MAVLCEAISVVIKRTSIDAYFEGGWERFLITTIENPSFCTDGELVRIGFMSPNEVQNFVEWLEQAGLQFNEGTVREQSDIAVIDQQRGLTKPCEWIEFANIPKGDSGSIAVCWLFEGDRISYGLHMPSASLELYTPDGWTYEGSLSEKFKFIETSNNA